MAVLKSRILETVESGLASLLPFTSEPSPEPFVLYGFAKYLMALKKPEAEILEVIQSGQRALSEETQESATAEASDVEWPYQLLTEIFPESRQVRMFGFGFGPTAAETLFQHPVKAFTRKSLKSLTPSRVTLLGCSLARVAT